MTQIAIGWIYADRQGRPMMSSGQTGGVIELHVGEAPPVLADDAPFQAGMVRLVPQLPGFVRAPVGAGVIEMPLPPGASLSEEQWEQALKDSDFLESFSRLEKSLIDSSRATSEQSELIATGDGQSADSKNHPEATAPGVASE